MTLRPYDEPLGSGADEVERIAGNQGQDFAPIRVQYRDVGRGSDLRGHHPILVLAPERRDRDDVARTNIAQGSKERVAMRRDPDVSGLSGLSRPWNVAGGSSQGASDPLLRRPSQKHRVAESRCGRSGHRRQPARSGVGGPGATPRTGGSPRVETATHSAQIVPL